MPFTFVHPVAVIPFRKFKIPLSALIIGSMAPDFNYFFLKEYPIGHTVLGQFYFCLPAGIAALLIFQFIIRKPLLDLLPESHSKVLVNVASPDLRNVKIWFYISAGILIGSFSHIIWDSFTHNYGFAVKEFPLLQREILIASYGTAHFFRILQHLSTLTGSVIIGILYLKWYKRQSLNTEYISKFTARKKILVILAITITAFALSVIPQLNSFGSITSIREFRVFTGIFLKTFLPVFTIFLTLFCTYRIVIEKS